MSRRAVRSPRTGFSLLEVVLAVALLAALVTLIGAALDFQLRQLTVRKTRIEESQLARAILRRMADDLRAVVVHRPVDFSSVATAAVSAATNADSGSAAASSGSSTSATSGATSSASSSGSSGSSSSSSESTAASDIASSAQPPAMPGLYGNAYELQVDVSRVPRYEEYALLGQMTDDPNMGFVSDVKTIAYFLLDGTRSFSSTTAERMEETVDGLGLLPDEPLQGLARRVVDRAAARYAATNGDMDYMELQVERFAPEVAAMEFRYFDGRQWLMEWDTELMKGLPMAVEITIGIARREPGQNNRLYAQPTLTQQLLDASNIYRLVVHLPAAEPIDTQSTTSEQTDTSSSTGTSSGSTSSASSGSSS
jgi:hypothetical protein